jgi:DNA mismatch endonuclease (patch repair protein)
MKATRQRDTAAEIALRRLLHARGLRFRLHRQLLPQLRRHADIAFMSARVAVFVDGCFWHSCPIHATSPKANQRWWAEKLAANRRRDKETNRRLRAAGWLVIRVWEHEAPMAAAVRIARAVRERRRHHSIKRPPQRQSPRRGSPAATHRRRA